MTGLYEPLATCQCSHTFRQHQTARGYCGYCECEAFVLAEVQPAHTPVQLKQVVAPAPIPAPAYAEGQPSPELLGKLSPYYRDNLYSLLLAIPEANTGDWYGEFINALEVLDANPTKANRRPKELRAALDDEVTKLKQEIVRLAKEGSPGVLHDVDRAFYKLAISERDAERHRVDMLRLANKELEAKVEELEAKTREMALQGLTSEGEWIEMTKELKDKLAALKRSGEVCECCIENECDCMEGVTWGEGSGSDTVDEGADELPRQED